jgi:hypothetical protein
MIASKIKKWRLVALVLPLWTQSLLKNSTHSIGSLSGVHKRPVEPGLMTLVLLPTIPLSVPTLASPIHDYRTRGCRNHVCLHRHEIVSGSARLWIDTTSVLENASVIVVIALRMIGDVLRACLLQLAQRWERQQLSPMVQAMCWSPKTKRAPRIVTATETATPTGSVRGSGKGSASDGRNEMIVIVETVLPKSVARGLQKNVGSVHQRNVEIALLKKGAIGALRRMPASLLQLRPMHQPRSQNEGLGAMRMSNERPSLVDMGPRMAAAMNALATM